MEVGKSQKGERARPGKRCRVPSIRWRQRAEPQAKERNSKKKAYMPPENTECSAKHLKRTKA